MRCSSPLRFTGAAFAAAAAAAAPGLVAQPVVSTGGETMRLAAASVTARPGGGWNVDLTMQDDNGNASLPTSWRRWWHCQIDGLQAGGETLFVTVRNAGYSDVILPVWSTSTDGAQFGAYTRLPPSAVPVVSGSTHRFTVTTPPGVVSLRLAKYFPYTTADKAALLASIAGHPSGRVRGIRSLGASWQGRAIERVQLTDPNVPDPGKVRVWVHAGVHPAETTSYFMVEGLIGFLLSSDPAAADLAAQTIFDIVPMANPDGVALGNYRTNSRSVEIESQWASPYNSPEREVVALRTEIEQLMGTAASPGTAPIQVLLNLHSTHNIAFPFHFQHSANPSWNPVTNNSGVVPAVNALEARFIADFRNRSAFVARGSTLSSSCGAPVRPFVECMMHDRWSATQAWASAGGAPVMAITFEGTYGRGPDGVQWNTPDDYRRVGAELARALHDYLGLVPVVVPSVLSYGPPCGASLAGTASPSSAGATVRLTTTGAPPAAPGVLLFGALRTVLPLPAPWSCFVLTQPLADLPIGTDSAGTAVVTLPFPPVPGAVVDVQAAIANTGVAPIQIVTSNGIEVRN